jgi:hypothetical protein
MAVLWLSPADVAIKATTWDRFLDILPILTLVGGAVLAYLGTWLQWRRQAQREDRTRFTDVKRQEYVRFQLLVRAFDNAVKLEKEARARLEGFGDVADPLDPRYDDYDAATRRHLDAHSNVVAGSEALLDCVESVALVAPLGVTHAVAELATVIVRGVGERQAAESQFRWLVRRDLGVRD